MKPEAEPPEDTMDRVAAEVTEAVAFFRSTCPNVIEAALVALTTARVMLALADAPAGEFSELVKVSKAAAVSLKAIRVVDPDGHPEVKA